MGQRWFAAVAYPSDSCRTIDTVPCLDEDVTKPRFRFQHRAASTMDDDHRFFVTSRYVFDSVFPALQLLFAVYTLYLWNYASFARFVFSRDKLDWVGEMYFALCISGLTSTTLSSLAVLYMNSMTVQRRQRTRSDRQLAEYHSRAPGSFPSVVFAERLQVKAAVFTYSQRILPAMDAHYDFHAETGHHGGDPKTIVLGFNYFAIVALTIVDFGLLVDATNKGKSYASPRAGGFGFLQILCLLVGLLLTVLPPRRAYQDVAQAYLEERFV
jgi:hypothetical protein